MQVDADELFTADSVNLEDIRIFKGGRIDRAILYAASILNQSCETLRGLFRQIIEDRTDILYPVKDLETHYGLGFAAWCDNNRVLIGNRAYMEKEGVPVPETEYEEEHSHCCYFCTFRFDSEYIICIFLVGNADIYIFTKLTHNLSGFLFGP